MSLEGARIDRQLIGLVVLVLLLSVPIYMGSSRVEAYVHKRLISDVVSIVAGTFDNIERELKERVGDQDVVIALFHNEALRREVERELSLLITPEIKYVYIVYRDEEGKFRFLADGSREDRGELGEKLDVLREDVWLEAMNTGRDRLILFENLNTIGATYIKPIVQNGITRAMLVADFSIEKIEEMKGALDLVRNAASLSVISAITFLGVALYQYQRKRWVERRLFVDELTGLYTRVFIENRPPNIGNYYIALLDIDDFRKVNITYGEEVGDAVLKELASFLKERLPNGFVVRYSGEEFLLFIPKKDFGGKSDAIRFVEGLREEIKKNPFPIGEDVVSFTVSVGINLSTEKSRSLENVIKGADRALYRAKREGKDRVEAYDESVEELKKSLSVGDVRSAIEEGRVLCLYQPIVNMRTGEISHYEALARIRDESGKLVAPAQFLEDIKGTFIYTRLTREVIRINAELLRKRKDLEISVNLIPTDLLDEAIVSELEGLERNVRRRLLLEITEVEGIPSFEKMRSAVALLRKLGYRICIDDFGAGYSNLVSITQLKIDYLKIDGSIVRDIPTNKVSYLLSRTITSFCKEVGIKVIAEYVENEAIYRKLLEIGVDCGQGYYFQKPVAVNSI